MNLFIEFDDRQLAFETDVPELWEYVSSSFHHMLVPGLRQSAGRLAVFRTAGGFVLESAEVQEYPASVFRDLLPIVKDEVRLQFMRDRPDLLWMHAGAVERGGSALLLSGPSGQGKSTLSTYLCDFGWKFLSDDVSPLRMSEIRVVPFLQTPVRRLSGGREVAREELGSLHRETVKLRRDELCVGESAIGAVTFLDFQHGSAATLIPLSSGAGAMELLRNATNFFDHRVAAVATAVQLVGSVQMFRLTYGNSSEGAKLLNARVSLVPDNR